MTTKLNPDGPQLELDGEPMEGDVLSDSEWEGLDETDYCEEDAGKYEGAL